MYDELVEEQWIWNIIIYNKHHGYLYVKGVAETDEPTGNYQPSLLSPSALLSAF